MACDPIGEVCASFFGLFIMKKLGMQNCGVLGMVLNAVSSLVFGFAPLITTSPGVLVPTFIICRLVNGAATTLTYVSIFTLLCCLQPHKLGEVTARANGLVEIGLVIGPPFGGFLHHLGTTVGILSNSVGAFGCPFVGCSIILIAPSVMLWRSRNIEVTEEEEEAEEDGGGGSLTEEISRMGSVLSVPMLSAVLMVTTTMILSNALFPILGPHLEEKETYETYDPAHRHPFTSVVAHCCVWVGARCMYWQGYMTWRSVVFAQLYHRRHFFNLLCVVLRISTSFAVGWRSRRRTRVRLIPQTLRTAMCCMSCMYHSFQRLITYHGNICAIPCSGDIPWVRRVMLSGLLLNIVAFALMGPCPLFGTPESMLLFETESTMIAAQLLVGASCALTLIPGFLLFEGVAVKHGRAKLKREHVIAIAGTLYNASYSLGCALGPLLAGVLSGWYPFAETTNIISVMTLVIIIYVCVQAALDKGETGGLLRTRDHVGDVALDETLTTGLSESQQGDVDEKDGEDATERKSFVCRVASVAIVGIVSTVAPMIYQVRHLLYSACHSPMTVKYRLSRLL